MEWIKKHWKEIVIVLLLLFSLNKCTQSCSRGIALTESEKNRISIEQTKDSIIKVYDDSIKNLTKDILVLEATINGNEEMIKKLSEANAQITEAKKNINVNVRTTNR